MFRQLEAEIIRQGMSKRVIAEQLGIKYNTLLYKLKKKSPFTYDEAIALKEILRSNLPVEELMKFDQIVS